MKSIAIIMTVGLLLLVSPDAMAQDDILGAIMEAAAAQEDAGNQAQSEADNAAQSEAAAQWQEAWEEMMEENGEIMDALDTKYLKCLAMMEMYVHMYLKLVDEHKIGEISMSACDAYGMQTLALAASTTIMYCPEGMKSPELSDEERIMLSLEYNSLVYLKEPLYSTHTYLFQRYMDWVRESGYEPVDPNHENLFHNYVPYLMEFFRPRYIIPRTLEIAQEMEVMGCSKPN